MNLNRFQAINADRARQWHDGNLDQWSLLEWAGAMAGEAGEACNTAKKLRRLDCQLPNLKAGLSIDDAAMLRDNLAHEVADTIIYGLLLLSVLDKRASDVLAAVFDAKSIEYGFPHRAHVELL